MWVDVLIFAALFLVAASPLVMVHELGHFAAARAAAVRVAELNVGIGPWVIVRCGRGGTIYRVGLLPLGAFCSLDERSYRESGPRSRLLVSAAGSGANFLFALLVFVVVAPFELKVAPVIEVETVGSAMAAGLHGGDRIVAVDGVAVDDWQDVGVRFVDRLGDTGALELDVERAGERLRRAIAIEDWQAERRQVDPFASLGMRHSPVPTVLDESIGARLAGAVRDTFTVGFATVASGIKMLANDMSVLNFGGGLWLALQGEDNANLLAAADREALAWTAWLKVLALLSMGLGMINLLPGPLVDGSGIVSALLSIVTRRPSLPERLDRALILGGSVVGFGPLVLCSCYEVVRFF